LIQRTKSSKNKSTHYQSLIKFSSYKFAHRRIFSTFAYVSATQKGNDKERLRVAVQIIGDNLNNQKNFSLPVYVYRQGYKNGTPTIPASLCIMRVVIMRVSVDRWE
jgi:hypothetical protein